MNTPNPLDTIIGYHAHIYFKDATERAVAETLRARIGERFRVQLGRWHDRLVGPHARPMYQVAFEVDQFAAFVPWLMINRAGLTILVHPDTRHPRQDHLVNALWLGEVLPILNVEQLPVSTVGEPDDAIVPNTTPTLAA
ncbi:MULTISPECIES: DOPA 4,5-dioxygenase family protein [unclassified Beijerinckia]|uniref:DOPA 4,5-dioxygenase family protein n=1 Tax=unclassified Beijerinckia TaxID=2638183 RepID=UPI001FCCE084|nr:MULTISPECIES: DOPA 4,5-dioxygenase family protein [unclassified Beijerinckia]